MSKRLPGMNRRGFLGKFAAGTLAASSIDTTNLGARLEAAENAMSRPAVQAQNDAAGARESRQLRIGDGSAWTFFNGPWRDGKEGSLEVEKSSLHVSGPAMQGFHYAFLKGPAFNDLQATFEVSLMGHTDAGLIFRASSPAEFYVLNFPNCGQASRAQNFWVSLARMDADGYQRFLKLELVRRVPSNLGIWLPVSLQIKGTHIDVQIGDYGRFEADHIDDTVPGRVGIYLFRNAKIRRVTIEGLARKNVPWDENKQPRKTWFYPSPETQYGKWQRPGQVVRTPAGDLLLNYTVQEEPFKGKITSLMLRSSDNGKTWSKPEPLKLKAGEWENQAIIHVFPDGKLRMVMPSDGTYTLVDAVNDGREWAASRTVRLPSSPPGIKKVSQGPQAFLNLADGSVVLFGYGSHDSTIPGANIWQWGAFHCQAFAARSRDNGLTWSDWVNVDNPGVTHSGKYTLGEAGGKQIGGNLDLTELCGTQTANGKILALIRPIYSPWMWEASSSDGGHTWDPVLRGPFAGYACPNMLRTRTGAILVAHRLPELTVHTSLDDGRTFDQGTLIDSGLWAMGSMIEVETNLVLYVYWDSFESLMRAQFIRVTPRGIEPQVL